jgi:hypothetical protein
MESADRSELMTLPLLFTREDGGEPAVPNSQVHRPL